MTQLFEKNDCELAFDLLAARPDTLAKGKPWKIEIRRKIAAPGQLSDGTRVFIVTPCDRWRWLTIELGWDIVAQFDQRSYFQKPEKLAQDVIAAIDARCGTYQTETTPEGEQTLVPGVDPIDQRKRLETRQDQPLRGKAAPCDLGLFDTGARNQLDLF